MVSTTLLGLLAAWSPFPISWWRSYPHGVIVGSEALVTFPAILGLAFVFSKLFKRHAFLSAAICMASAFVATSVDTFREPGAYGPMLREVWPYFLPYVIGPSLLLLVATAVRSNQRLERP